MKYSLHLFQVPAYNIKKKKGMSMEKIPKHNIPRNAQKTRSNVRQIRYCVFKAKVLRSPTKYPFVENAQYKRKINNCMNIKKTQQPKGCRVFFGAGGGGRTRTVLPPPDFESGTSASSITPANHRSRRDADCEVIILYPFTFLQAQDQMEMIPKALRTELIRMAISDTGARYLMLKW